MRTSKHRHVQSDRRYSYVPAHRSEGSRIKYSRAPDGPHASLETCVKPDLFELVTRSVYRAYRLHGLPQDGTVVPEKCIQVEDVDHTYHIVPREDK
jgi:hypothetical protein